MARPAARRVVLAARVLAAVGLAAAGCGGNDDAGDGAATAGVPSTRVGIEANEWVLDREDSALTVDDDNPVTLGVDGNTVSGRAPCNTCNTAGSSWELDGDELTVGPARSTQMACVDPPGVMEQEAALLQALESAARVEIAPGTLTILDAEGAIAIVAVQG